MARPRRQPEALARVPAAPAAHPAALRRLPREGPALPWPVDCTTYPAACRCSPGRCAARKIVAREEAGRPDDLRGLQAVTHDSMDRFRIGSCAKNSMSSELRIRACRDRRRPGGGLGRLRQSSINMLKFASIIHSSRMLFCTRWKPPARPRRAPAGSRSTSSPRPKTAQSLGVVPGVSEIALARRIRVRCRLGRGLRARGRQLLPEAAGLGAVHARNGAAAAGAAGRECRADPARAGERPDRACRTCATPHRCMSPSRRKTNGACSASSASSSATISNSIGRTRTTRRSTISSTRSPRASARRSSASAARRARPRHRGAVWLTGSRFDRKRLGSLSSRSTWRPARANGAGRI